MTKAAMSGNRGCYRACRLINAFQRPIVEKKISRIDIGGEPGFVALQYLPLGVLGDSYDGEDFPPGESGLGIGERVGSDCNLKGFIRVSRFNKGAAEFRPVLVDNSDRDVAEKLAEIRLRVKQAIDDGRQHDHAEDTLIAKHTPEFGEHR